MNYCDSKTKGYIYHAFNTYYNDTESGKVMNVEMLIAVIIVKITSVDRIVIITMGIRDIKIKTTMKRKNIGMTSLRTRSLTTPMTSFKWNLFVSECKVCRQVNDVVL